MAARRRQRKSSGAPAWLWLLAGLVIGAAIPAALLWNGYLPAPRSAETATPGRPGTTEPALIEEPAAEPAESQTPRYDFFTVLPEMEVVVPDRDLEAAATATDTEAAPPPGGTDNAFVLQAGSFRSAADAEEMKARLALLGVVARVQAVTVDDATWHRVRVGPVDGARAADDMRRRLENNGIDTLVMQAQ